jgi:hypothetical protein
MSRDELEARAMLEALRAHNTAHTALDALMSACRNETERVQR